ncbi:MAG: hypothetical protein PHD49_01360 [Candidatus Shapirobacteria bacterium]|nr:hypothetical protein [Candidatus Shapirobacteria bacterium]MDD4382769.1 hypothetical protein [Candidatus Shapirobacteria bacterium]
MESIKEIVNTNLPPDYYEKFLRPNNKLILDPKRIDLVVFCGNEREILKTPTNGDSSLLLRYKGKEGAVLSMETVTEELSIVQLQGSKSSVSYQVSTGFLWVRLFGDQVKKIVFDPQSEFERISMPHFEKIVGLYDSGTDAALGRYQQLANILGLRFSNQEWKFIKETREPLFNG